MTYIDLLNQKYYTLPETDGTVSVSLAPYQSVLLFVGKTQDFPLLKEIEMQKKDLELVWDISLYDTVEEKVIAEYKNQAELFNLNGYDAHPNFVGKASYSTRFSLSDDECDVKLHVHAEGQTVEVSVNGSPFELQICKPFVFDISDKVHAGENTLEISLCNTLANRIDERYTAYLPVYPGGMITSPEIYTNKNK